MNRILSRNYKIKHKYHLHNQLECGMILQGTEVKSLKLKKVDISNAYIIFKKQEMFLVGLKIPHLTICQSYNHNIMRSRKIIAKKKEIQHIHNIYNKKGICLIPIQLIEKKKY